MNERLGYRLEENNLSWVSLANEDLAESALMDGHPFIFPSSLYGPAEFAAALAYSRKSNLTRRQFIHALILGLPGVLVACSPAQISHPETETRLPEAAPKDQLLAAVDGLPESTIKTFLNNKGLELLNNQTSIEIGSLTMNKVPLQVKFTKSLQSLDTVIGKYQFRSENPEGPYYPQGSSTFQYPVLFLTEEEKRTIKKDPLKPPTNDGTPLVTINFPTDKPFFQGMAPLITVQSPENNTVLSATAIKRLETFVLVKELLSGAIEIAYLSEVVNFLSNYKYQLTIKTDSGDIEALSQIHTIILNHNGRILAVQDIAPTVAAIWAFAGTEIEPIISAQPGWGEVAQNILKARPTTSFDVFQTSTQWVLNNLQAADKIPHNGELSNIP